MQAHILTLDELKELCAQWQEILRLQDWQVAVSISRARDFEGENACGECRWVLSRKEALIRILDPLDYSPNNVFPQDMERTLVHELLHLHFAEISEKAEAAGVNIDTSLEQALHGIDGALANLRRGG
jgi:hypothetical protein